SLTGRIYDRNPVPVIYITKIAKRGETIYGLSFQRNPGNVALPPPPGFAGSSARATFILKVDKYPISNAVAE
ncbi:MAG: hypothetical protein L3J89_14255, partial [Gammaproteobacteria bacterium]|nr:hypothetical protein [Gammaproteobacteria bacterium]